MFSEMLGDLKNAIYWIGAAVVISLIFVAGNAMAMAMRERTTEVAVLKAIGFNKRLVLIIVMAEAVLVAGIGGRSGSAPSAARPCSDLVDITPYTGGISAVLLRFPWNITLLGVAVSLLIGFLSGFFPAIFAANASVIDGLRKVIWSTPAIPTQVQPVGNLGGSSLEDDTADGARHRPGRLVFVHFVRDWSRGLRTQPAQFQATRST